jgi:ATP-binding cassette subfamily C protein CydD
VRGWETIKLFKAEETVEKSVIEAGNAYKKSTLGILKTAFLSAFSLEFLATIATALVAVEIGFRVLYGRMDYETAITILILAPEFYIPLRNLGAAFHASVSGIEAMNSVGEFLNLPIPNFPVPTTSTVRELTQEEKANWSQIVLENVTVSYPNRGEPVLKNLSISLSRGEIVALVGPSGSGKSTFCHLLMGHLAPSAGQIWLENTPRVCISENSWHSLFSSIPQRPALAHATLRDNILLGRENVSEASIARACEMAQLTPILDKLPLKLETPVGENGVTLSTGQAHRVALARTFLSQSPIVILDEPTAHLDPKTEDAIHMSIKELSKTRTVIIVSHRESTLRFCDAILRFENRHVTKTPLKGKRS